jgi:aryl-alcohol dehydrogenase-like predicted oxidoreductase
MLPLISIARSDLKLSALCLGATAFGPAFPADMGEALYSTFREAGGNCFDTAHCYCFWDPSGNGAAERNLGAAIRKHGDSGRVFVISKGGHPAVPPAYVRSEYFLSPEVVDSDVAESLDRLQMDKIDLYLLHRDDTRAPVGEIIDMLNRHIAAGRLSAVGASNWSTARMAEANAYAAKHGLHGFVASQPQFNLGQPNTPPPTADPAMRYLTAEDIAWHDRTGLPVICYSPTANGYFGSAGERAKSTYDNPTSRARLARATELAGKLGVAVNQITLAYLLCQGFGVIPVLGTSSAAHLKESMLATEVRLSLEQVRWLENG